MPSHDLILGVDGGGSKTVAWLQACDSTASVGDSLRESRRHSRSESSTLVLGRGSGGPSNLQAAGPHLALQNLGAAIDAAFADAGLEPATVAAACLALAGADREHDRQTVEAWANARRLARRLRVVNDAAPILAAGTRDGWGVALISGTGSFAFGQSATAAVARAGGWGHLFGDEGSGYWIALAGLRAAARAADGRGPATVLLDRFLAALDKKEAAELIPAVYGGGTDRAAIASLAKLVLDSAAEGDAVASGIVHSAAVELAELAAAVARRLGFAGQPYPLALAGGVLTRSESLRRQLRQALEERGCSPGDVAIVSEPVAGSVLLARCELNGMGSGLQNSVLPG